MVYSRARPPSNHRRQWLNWNWARKCWFLHIRKEQQRSKYLSMFPIELFGVKINPAKSTRNLGEIWLCAAHALFLIWDLRCIHHYLALQNNLKWLLCLAVSIIVIHVCVIMRTLTSPNFNIFRTDWTELWQNHLRLLAGTPLLHSHQWLPVKCRRLFKISLITYKILHGNSRLICTTYLLPQSHPMHWDQAKELVCQSLGSRPTQAKELFTLVSRLVETSSYCLSIQPFQLPPSRNISRHISLTWPFPHRRQHTQWPIDVTELFHRFCCWTPIWLSRHCACFRHGYWRYRNLINWLIDWSIHSFIHS